MRVKLYFIVGMLSVSCYASEWQSLNHYKNETGLDVLTAKDWLKSDRKRNTKTWHDANEYNLNHLLSSEYSTITQRRDFYEWYYNRINAKGHEVIWPKMAYFISKKLRLTQAFPYAIFTKQSVKVYANKGSETVFNQCFSYLKMLYNASDVIQSEKAIAWDEMICHDEQYLWLNDIYDTIDDKTLKTLTRMAKGKGFYALLVPCDIVFVGDLTDAEDRYGYALNVLKPYCDERYH